MTNERKFVTLEDIESRHLQEHRKPYFDWIRHVVYLATVALTALIALQGNYLPNHPQLPILLAACWLALLVTILLGIFALRSEYSTSLQAFHEIQKSRTTIGDTATQTLISRGGLMISPVWHHRWAVRLMVVFFVLSLLFLCTFAIFNIGGFRD